MILVEGADCTGKTTLCKKLSEELGIEYKHLTKPGPQFVFPHSYFPLIGEHVQDRLHLSEIAYGETIYGNRLNKGAFLAVEHWLKQRGAVVVLLIAMPAHYEQMREVYENNGQMFSFDQVLAVNEYFRHKLVPAWSPSIDHVHHNIDCWPASSDALVELIAKTWRSKRITRRLKNG